MALMDPMVDYGGGNARPPQQLVGIGFTAQGVFIGEGYKRICFDPAFDWVFSGINDDVIGDFGFSGNGAAGFELDRVDPALVHGLDITILAQSFGDSFMLVPEEQLTHLTICRVKVKRRQSVPIWFM